MNWQKQHVLVTGGTRGIGRAMVENLVKKGARVTATGSTLQSIQQAQDQRPSVQWICCDLLQSDARTHLAKLIERSDINLVIHNAGVQQIRDYTQESPSLISTAQELDINLLAPIELTRSILPFLRHRKDAMLVFITSGLALAPKQSSPVYCASKAGLRSFAKALRGQLQMKHWPVKVVEALPPIVDTDMTRGRGSRKMSATDAAQQILAGLEKGKSEIYVGASKLLKVILRISPSLGERIMLKR
jgi:uncharacterized oxidoreductase